MIDTEQQKYTAPSRKGKHLIGAYFSPEIKRELKTIAAQEDSSIQALLEEAVAALIDARKNT